MKNTIKKSFQYGEHQVTIETGGVARQATAAVMVTMGETIVLATVVVGDVKEGVDFFPLTVEYQERAYAGGRIPGGYFKREGRPTEKETLTSRLIDRPIRPLFAEGFYHEVQVIVAVLSLDPKVSADIPAMLGASAALSISGLPFQGPIAAARVSYQEGVFILNANAKALENSELDLVVAGTQAAVLMVESEARELSEEIMLTAVMFGHQQMQVAIDNIRDFAQEANQAPLNWQPVTADKELTDALRHACHEPLSNAYQNSTKIERNQAINHLRQQTINALATEAQYTEKQINNVFEELKSQIVRERILSGGLRIDGRDNDTVRDIHIRTNILPRTHGSALFTRGETQALVVATLGSGKDAQTIDALEGEIRENFMLHYNFPPYSVGETGKMTGPRRREIGHGKLAKRALEAVIPNQEDFPYVIRVVSEITESNGSSSMASVCGASLALMDAGVPIKAPVAGIAMGLIKEGDKFAVLTDILGDEDHLGDMDFKVAGTAKGITALQMDIKIDGITREIMEKALRQAKVGRIHILALMNTVISKHQDNISVHAPRIFTIKISPDKIREVIGKGGATIQALTKETNTTIDIADDGTIKIAATDTAGGEQAVQRIEQLTCEAEVGKIYQGTVTRLMDFGAFVSILPGKEGLVHISQITNERVERVTDYLQEGQQVTVKLIEIDRQGRMRLSMKEAV